jgi:hypothetical protein
MTFHLRDDRGNRSQVRVDELIGYQLRQASAVADGLARLIPHEGVDYEISPGENSIIPLTDKGEGWREYVELSSDGMPSEDMRARLAEVMPKEGVDFDPVIVFSGSDKSRISFEMEIMTERGSLWKSYVMKMIRKYPPTLEYAGEMLPDGGETENVEGVENEEVVP